MDKQTFYSELTERLTKLCVDRYYIERHMKQFDSFFEGKREEEISQEIARLGDLDRVAARIKRMTDKLMEQEHVQEHVQEQEETQAKTADEPTESAADTTVSEIKTDHVAEAAPAPEQTNLPETSAEEATVTPADDGLSDVEPLFDDEDIISFTPISGETGADVESEHSVISNQEDIEIRDDKPLYHGRKRGELAVSDPGRIVKSTLDEETVRKNTVKFWLLFVLTLPITLAVVAVTAAVFALIFFVIAVLIIAFVAALVAVTAAGTLISVFGLIFGVALMMSSLPIGLYECGLSIIVGATAMFVGILLYNIAVRLLPFIAKWLLVLFKLIFRKYKELFVYLKKECIGL